MKASQSRLSLLAGSILVVTAISQILLATDRITIAIAASGLVGLVVFCVLVSIVREVAAEVESDAAHERRASPRGVSVRTGQRIKGPPTKRAERPLSALSQVRYS